jgi:membrane fusion protein, heavy metal efflux system
MNKKKLIFLALLAALLGGVYWYASQPVPQVEGTHTEEGHGHDHADEESGEAHVDEHGHGEEEVHSDRTEISDASAKNAGIETLEAGAGAIRETVSLTGRIALNQNTTAQVRARFPGIVRSVSKGLGEQTSAGETLATVESNDSLLTYPVKAPISGMILQRNTNIGDVAGEQPLFVIANLSNVWGEFYIFPRDLDRIATGQKVIIHSTDGELQTKAAITSLLPVAEASSQTVMARVTIDNPEGKWRAGMTVRGEVVIAERQVPLAVKTAAIQRLEGSTVLFMKEGESYAARKVELGMNDSEWTEIKSGVKPGEQYVATGSFVVKADIGKAGAEHEH